MNYDSCIALPAGSTKIHSAGDLNQMDYPIATEGCDSFSNPPDGTAWFCDTAPSIVSIKHDDYAAFDCSGVPFRLNATLFWEMIIGCFSGVWYVWIGVEPGVIGGLVFFYATGTSTTLTNSLSSWTVYNGVTIDDPLIDWWFGGPTSFTGVGKNGTVTIHIP